MVSQFSIGEEVRIDIPDKTDPDFEEYHGRSGQVVNIFRDNLRMATERSSDGFLYTIRFDDGTTQSFREKDLRPTIGTDE